MARRKAATFDAQRGAIRDAAARLFADKGFATTSMADIAAACGVSKALLYHYYRDKEHLLFDIAESYIERLQRSSTKSAEAATGRGASAPDRPLHDRVRTLGDTASVLVQDVKYLSRAHRARVVARQRDVVDGFARVVGGSLPQRPATMAGPLAMILFGMMNWTFTWLRDDGTLKHEDLAPVVSDLFIGGLGRVRPPLWPVAANAHANTVDNEPESERMSTAGPPRKRESRARGARVVQ